MLALGVYWQFYSCMVTKFLVSMSLLKINNRLNYLWKFGYQRSEMNISQDLPVEKNSTKMGMLTLETYLVQILG